MSTRPSGRRSSCSRAASRRARRPCAGLPADSLVIAADSGLDHAQAVGWPVDYVVGDLDSVGPAALAAAEQQGATVERHPIAKDQTDLGLAPAAGPRARCGACGRRGWRWWSARPPARQHVGARLVRVLRCHHRGPPSSGAGARGARPARSRRASGRSGEPAARWPRPPASPPRACSTRSPATRCCPARPGASATSSPHRASVSVAGGVLLAVVPGGRGTHFDLIDQEETPSAVVRHTAPPGRDGGRWRRCSSSWPWPLRPAASRAQRRR